MTSASRTLPRLLLLPLMLSFAAAAVIATTRANNYTHHHNVERSLKKGGGPSPLWDESESRHTYEDYPAELTDLLDTRYHALMRSPELRVFTTVPEPSQRVWPLVWGMTLRNHLQNKILWAKPNYLISDGLEIGCREPVDEENHTEVESALCQQHCTHRGRYCAPFQPSDMPAELPAEFAGKELVKESLRRCCFDHYYHASDTKYFEYLEGFDRAQCLQADDVSACALSIFKEVDHADYNNLAACVDEASWEKDVTNDMLESQLKAAKQYGTTLQSVPELRFGHNLYKQEGGGQYTVNSIFEFYCNSFDSRPMRPVSCDVCGECQNVRKCLWTLECDGEAFDPIAFLNSLHGENEPDDDEQAMDTNTATSNPPANNAAVAAATINPEEITAPQSTTTDNNKNTYHTHSNSDQADGQVIMIFFILAITLSALTAAFFVYRDRRTRFLMAEIHAQRVTDSHYTDGDSYVDFVAGDESIHSSPSSSHEHGDDDDDDDLEMSPTNNNKHQKASSQPPSMAFSLPEMT